MATPVPVPVGGVDAEKIDVILDRGARQQQVPLRSAPQGRLAHCCDGAKQLPLPVSVMFILFLFLVPRILRLSKQSKTSPLCFLKCYFSMKMLPLRSLIHVSFVITFQARVRIFFMARFVRISAGAVRGNYANFCIQHLRQLCLCTAAVYIKESA